MSKRARTNNNNNGGGGGTEGAPDLAARVAAIEFTVRSVREDMRRQASRLTTTFATPMNTQLRGKSQGEHASYAVGAEPRRTILDHTDLTVAAPGMDYQDACDGDKQHPEERLKELDAGTATLDSVTRQTKRGYEVKTTILSSEDSYHRQGVHYFMLAEQVRRNTALLQHLFTQTLPAVCSPEQTARIQAECAQYIQLAEVPHLREDPATSLKRLRDEAEAHMPADHAKRHCQTVSRGNMAQTAVSRLLETGRPDSTVGLEVPEDMLAQLQAKRAKTVVVEPPVQTATETTATLERLEDTGAAKDAASFWTELDGCCLPLFEGDDGNYDIMGDLGLGMGAIGGGLDPILG